jgi:hypothetical protein
MQQQRNFAVAEDNLIAAHAGYAKDRAGLYQTLASTLQHYGINLTEAASRASGHGARGSRLGARQTGQ